MSIKRIYVEKKSGERVAAQKVRGDIETVLGIETEDVRLFLRYDVEGLEGKDFDSAVKNVFSEPPVDIVYLDELPSLDGYKVFGTEYLPGQYDQRADSAAQCVQLLTMGARPEIRTATVYAVAGVGDEEMKRIEKYLVNPVEARICSFEMPDSLKAKVAPPDAVRLVDGFNEMDKAQIEQYRKNMGFAMSTADLLFVQAHYRSENRQPTETELKVIDTYWSDHCRHTTFLTTLQNVKIKSDMPEISQAYETYLKLFNAHHKGRADKYPCLMDIATMGAREIKARGGLENLDASEEINACSINVTADVNGKSEDWLVMFKNETHNHPTEIEPFGGAATCLGGAIRDPLSGRSYVYQAMRITGAADVNAPIEKTMKGKLPQRVISKTAAAGFSSYGNQIGLSTGLVREMYHPGYVAKRLETGYVVAAAPKENVVRGVPQAGDAVLLIGGETGRDGCGGATGSSKVHTVHSLDSCGAEVQKGNPLTERKIQRLMRDKSFTTLVKRCNDFGAGGVSVAIGELSSGLDIDLDAVPKKYAGLSATELAISESQERMAVVVAAADVEKATEKCAKENLTATVVAKVTDTARMRMYCGGRVVVDLPRKFLDSNGARQTANVTIKENAPEFFDSLGKERQNLYNKGDYVALIKNILADENVCSQKGLGETFDGSIGAGSVLMPFGGKTQLTPAVAMAAKLPVENGETNTVTVSAYGCNPALMSLSPFVGAQYSVILSVIKAVAAGAPFESIRLTFQEFFERLFDEPERWGKPTSALLGALEAQLRFGLAAIGGKDSMSGTFEKTDVPPTLISFALGVGRADEIIDNVLKKAGQKVYRYRLPRKENGIADYEELVRFLKLLHGEIARKRVDYVSVVEDGGAIGEIVKSCLGEGLGFAVNGVKKDFFTPALGDILLSCADPEDFVGYDLELIGFTTNEPTVRIGCKFKAMSCDEYIYSGGRELPLEEARKAFTGTFEAIYPTVAPANGRAENVNYERTKDIKPAAKTVGKAKPKVFIPVFPGNNCEYDVAKRFAIAGGEPMVYVVRNRTPQEIDESVKEMAKLIKECKIIAFPGGFTGGDEPDGSGKFIATTFRNKRLSDAVNDLIKNRDGLALGICNGFQALVKMGLLPFGEIGELTDESATLTFNNIGRHVSTISKIRVASNLSPWLSNVKVGEVYNVAVSHGEGRFSANDATVKKLIENGQIATQYCDFDGNATMTSPHNPNGSVFAIEGITGPDGRVYGKMGHSERIGDNLMKNVGGESDMKIFEAGISYFK